MRGNPPPIAGTMRALVRRPPLVPLPPVSPPLFSPSTITASPRSPFRHYRHTAAATRAAPTINAMPATLSDWQRGLHLIEQYWRRPRAPRHDRGIVSVDLFAAEEDPAGCGSASSQSRLAMLLAPAALPPPSSSASAPASVSEPPPEAAAGSRAGEPLRLRQCARRAFGHGHDQG